MISCCSSDYMCSGQLVISHGIIRRQTAHRSVLEGRKANSAVIKCEITLVYLLLFKDLKICADVQMSKLHTKRYSFSKQLIARRGPPV